MKIERFEDLEAWKAARVLVSQVYDMTRQAQDTGRDYRFRDQVTAAAVSVMSNIANFQKIYAQAESVARLTSGLITYLLRDTTERSKSPKGSIETKGQGTTSSTQQTQRTP